MGSPVVLEPAGLCAVERCRNVLQLVDERFHVCSSEATHPVDTTTLYDPTARGPRRFPRRRCNDDIDAARPSPIGLVQTDSLNVGQNHQVLAYGYHQQGQQVRLFVYDPNTVGEQVTLSFDITNTSGEVHVKRAPANDRRIYCIFRMDGYQHKRPHGGRALTGVRELLDMVTGRRHGSLAAAGRPRPVSLRAWLRSPR